MSLSGQVLDDHGASAQKYIGDAVMGVWDHGRQRPEPDGILRVLVECGEGVRDRGRIPTAP